MKIDIKDFVILGLLIFIIWRMRKGSSNSEVWSWIDYRGNKRTLEVNRNVH